MKFSIKKVVLPREAMAIPIGGDDPEAIKVTTKLVRDTGFDPVLGGNLARSRPYAHGGPLYSQEITAKEMQ